MSIDSANIVTNANFEVQADTPEVGKTTIKLLQNINWVGALINKGSGDEALTISNFINLAENYIFDGDFKTIDMESYSCEGLFASAATSFANAPTVQNLNVIGGTTKKDGGFIIKEKQNYFIVNSCSCSGNISQSNSGGIAGLNSGISGECEIQNCYSTGNISGTYAGGITGAFDVGQQSGKCTVKYCYNTGEISGLYAGGISGFTGIEYIIYSCYNIGTISGSGAGGIIGAYSGYVKPSLIYYCYNTGDITGANAGGIVGEYAASSGGLVAIISCYSSGTLIGNNSGEIVGHNSEQDRVVMYNVYSPNGNGDLDDPKFPYVAVSDNNSGKNGSLDIDNGITLSDINTLPPLGDIQDFHTNFTGWTLTPIQTTAFTNEGTEPILTAFQSSPWSGYSVNSSTPTLQASEGGAEGDPHIYPILGTSYDYHKLGWSRYFADHKNDFIINCYIEMGEGYWNRRDMSYISHTVIHYKNSSIYIDNGFRGRATKIVNQIINPETPNNIKITEKTLPFDYDAKELCFNCCREVDDCWTNNMKCETDRREMIRNQITIETDKHKITFQNVNKYNRNPGKINLSLQTMDPSYEGIIVSKEFANKSLIRDCEDKTPLSNYYTTRSI